MTLGERIAFIIRELGLTQNSFAKRLGYKNNVQIGEYVGGTKPGWEFFQKLIQAVPSINLDWVVAEIGPPFKEKGTAATNTDEPAIRGKGLDPMKRLLDLELEVQELLHWKGSVEDRLKEMAKKEPAKKPATVK